MGLEWHEGEEMMAQVLVILGKFFVIYPVRYKSLPTNVPMSGPKKRAKDRNGFCSEFHFYGNKSRIMTSNELCLKLFSHNELLSVLKCLLILS